MCEKRWRQERWVSIILLGAIFSLSLISFLKKKNYFSPPLKAAPLSVTIIGEVKKPDTYRILPGTRFKDLLAKAKPKRFANLKKMDLERPLLADQTIQINKLSTITVYVKGAVVDSMTYVLPIGTRICDLKKYIDIKQDVSKDFIKRRSYLKDGQTVTIPFKK